MRLIRLVTLALVSGVLAAGCGEQGHVDEAPFVRLLESPPTSEDLPNAQSEPFATIFNPDVASVTAFLHDPGLVDPHVENGILAFKTSSETTLLKMRLSDHLRGVQLFTVDLQRPEGGRVSVLYGQDGQALTDFPPGAIAAPSDESTGMVRYIVYPINADIDMANANYLALRLEGPAGAAWSIKNIEAFRYTDAYLGDLANTTRQVRIHNDVRPVIPALVPSERVQKVKLPQDAWLSVSVGIPPECRDLLYTVIARIVLVEAGGMRHVLHETQLNPATDLSDRDWIAINVSLGEWSSQEVEFRFEVEGDNLVPLKNRFIVWSSPIVYKADNETPNIVIMVADTLRRDRIHAYGYERELTPNLDAFFRQSVVFWYAYSNSSWTLPSHASLFTSLLPQQHKLDMPFGCSLELGSITLAEIMRLNGYETIAVTGGGFLETGTSLNTGFEKYAIFPNPESATLEERAERLDSILKESGPRPRFVFIHHYLAHQWFINSTLYKYNIHASAQENEEALKLVPRSALDGTRTTEEPLSVLPEETKRRYFSHLYDSGVSLADEMMRLNLETLAKNSNGRPEIQIFTADHGEMMGEVPGAYGHGGYHYDPVVRVPLMIRFTDKNLQKSVESPVQLIDIYPTILDLAHLRPLVEFSGRSLTADIFGSGRQDQPDIIIDTNLNDRKLVTIVKNDNKLDYLGNGRWFYRPVESDSHALEDFSREDLQKVRKEYFDGMEQYLFSVDNTYVIRFYNGEDQPVTLEGQLFITEEPSFSTHVACSVRDWAFETDDILHTPLNSKSSTFKLTVSPGDEDFLIVMHPETDLLLEVRQNGRVLDTNKIRLGGNSAHPGAMPLRLNDIDESIVKIEFVPELLRNTFSVDLWKVRGFIPFRIRTQELREDEKDQLRNLGYLQ